MPEKKNLTRTFEAELRSLPIELVPPDPAGLERPAKQRTTPGKLPGQVALDSEPSLVAKLIDRIKRI
jgi:hypothetical protein